MALGALEALVALDLSRNALKGEHSISWASYRN